MLVRGQRHARRWRLGATTPSFSPGSIIPHPFRLALFFFLILNYCGSVTSQLVNGQFFTAGLAISDAPYPGSTFNAPGNIPIAIDVSGNGKLPIAARLPGSSPSEYPTAFQSLELYLVSAQTGINMTVSTGPGLLTQEPGSTVKHINFAIPTCLRSGAYNLTFYEAYRLNSEDYFAISPIPLMINSPSPSTTPCNSLNPFTPLGQASSSGPQGVWIDPSFKPTVTVFFPTASASVSVSASIKTKTQKETEKTTKTKTRLVTVTHTSYSVLKTTITLSGQTTTEILTKVTTQTITAPGETVTTTSTLLNGSVTTVTQLMVWDGGPTLVPVNEGRSRIRGGKGLLVGIGVMIGVGLIGV